MYLRLYAGQEEENVRSAVFAREGRYVLNTTYCVYKTRTHIVRTRIIIVYRIINACCVCAQGRRRRRLTDSLGRADRPCTLRRNEGAIARLVRRNISKIYTFFLFFFSPVAVSRIVIQYGPVLVCDHTRAHRTRVIEHIFVRMCTYRSL